MQHRSFRLSEDRRSRPRVVSRLRRLFLIAAVVDVLAGLGVLGLAVMVGKRTEFFRDQEPDWFVLIAFSLLVVLATQAARASVFAITRQLSQQMVGRWLTREQAEQFPGWNDPWPECWLESYDDGEIDGRTRGGMGSNTR